jgi:hypothetical protein
MNCLRDCQLEAQNYSLKAKRLVDQPGRADRDRLLAEREASQRADEATERFQKALADLHALDIYCLDAIRGLALIPFVHDNQLAWFIFDLFEPELLSEWRYHQDPLETRRPIKEVIEDAPGDNYVV